MRPAVVCSTFTADMPSQRSGIDGIEADAVGVKILSQQLRLPLTHGREAIVGLLPEGGLPVAD